MDEWNKNVKILRILNDDHEIKFAAIEGEVEEKEGEKKSAVLLFEKTPFQLDDVAKLMKDNVEQFKEDFVNDIYHKYTVEARSACNGMLKIKIYYCFLKLEFSFNSSGNDYRVGRCLNRAIGELYTRQGEILDEIITSDEFEEAGVPSPKKKFSQQN